MYFMDTNNTKPKRTYRRRRKTAPTPFDEAIDKYVNEALAGSKGSPQEVFSSAVQDFSKRLLEAMLQGEMDAHLKGITPSINDNDSDNNDVEYVEEADEDFKGSDFDAPAAEIAGKRNKRNGFSEKTLKTEYGPMTLDVPRDRHGTFDPIVVPKHSRSFGKIDEQIVTMYSRGMSTRDIQAFVRNLYGVNISPDYVSTVTDRVLDDMHEWMNRPLESVYPVAFFDAMRVKIRNGASIKNMAMHLAIGVRVDGTREVLGMWLAENEGAAFWASVFNSLKNRGVEDILIAVTDGLKGMTQAIEAAFPQCLHQTCIVHLMRASTAFVSRKDLGVVCKALKPIYQAVDAQAAEKALEEFEQSALGKKYPAIAQTWRRSWAQVVPFFQFPPEIRTLIYTTNSIEGLNRAIRKVIKTRSLFPTEESAQKLIYLAIRNVTDGWKRPSVKWSSAMPQFAIMFGERFTSALN